MINRGKTSTWKRTATAVMALGLVAGACSSSSGDESSDETEETVEGADADVGGADEATDDTEPAETEPADTEADEPDDSTEDTVDVVQSEGGLLAAVQDAGVLKCGANEALPGFGVVDSAGEYSGFDIDFCKVVAAGILGDAEAVEYVSLNADARFPALQAGEVDVLIRNTTWTASRDGDQGGNFLFTTFYDGQGVMVPEDSGITELEGLADASICVLSGTTTELNLSSVFTARGIPFNPVVFEDNTALRPAYEEGQCEAWTADASALASNKAAIEEEGGATQFIIPEVISKEPLGPVVVDGDTEWAQAVNWAVMAPVQAWEFGLDSSSIGSYDGDDPNIQTFLGQGDDVASTLGLPADYAVQIVEQVGNYQEIYDAHITPIGLSLEGSPNNLWTEGGLMYVPPFR
ncbi:amino acid ABC transporter substrate-binding protein [Ilumatobacter nonamiensis]|uniref:amino acid ABC transporter substrate-binding protein n=1 Tax=Ilumatobacter nonamiensis TaxID=467093 RepID=UPI000A04A24D|nr:amino acid ABC transporter substrate-binding protein [Ilumatobacter nonamiensis]